MIVSIPDDPARHQARYDALVEDETASELRPRDRFGFLLKHAWERMAGLSGDALREHGIGGRELAVLAVLAEGSPPSQLEAAQRLSIDRTTMVALLDDLETKELVERHHATADRRRNIVALTARGRRTLAGASTALNEAERVFLGPLAPEEGELLRRLLRSVVNAEGAGTSPGPETTNTITSGAPPRR